MSDKIKDFKHPSYLEHENQVARVSNIYDGVDSAKQYIQKYSQEETTDHSDRQDIATLDNFVFRTVEDIKNIIFRKPLDESGITNNDVKKYVDKIDLSSNLNTFSKRVLVNRIRDGFTFVLVDSSLFNEEEVVNKAQQNDLGLRPYLINITRKNLLSWKKNDLGQYTQIVIQDTYEVETDYSRISKPQIKIWNDDGTIEIWRDDEPFLTIPTGLTSIPIVKIGEDDIPPLYDLAKMNITHMNRDSEVSNYTRVGGAPFLSVFGDLDDGAVPKTLGINNGLRFKDKSVSDVRWVEMAGTNYEMLKDRILYHEEQMNRISVSFVQEQTNKTATQVNKESMTNESKATDYATQLEEGINDALELLDTYKVDGSYGENKIEVNKDFDSSILTPEMVKSYREDYTLGIISYDKLIEYLVAGEYFKKMDENEMIAEKARLQDTNVVD